jgi:alpha-tubulin suppressor-like RCC1 family protein
VTPTSISAGVTHALAIGSDHQLYAWGDNSSGELGDGSTTDQGAPEAITLAPGVTPTSVSAGGAISFAIGSDHQLYGWGREKSGGLGDGSNSGIVTRPTVISLGAGIVPTSVSAGNRFGLAIDSNNQVWGWGVNGPFGTYAAEVDSPKLVTIYSSAAGAVVPFTARAVSAGWFHSVAIGTDGRLYAWGDNRLAEISYQAFLNFWQPAGLDFPVPYAIDTGGVVPTQISAGMAGSMMTDAAGNIYTWGYAEVGSTNSNPCCWLELAPLPAGVHATAVSAGDTFFMAIGSDGNLYAWDGWFTGATFPAAPTVQPGIHPLAISAKGDGFDPPGPPLEGTQVALSPYFLAIG